MTKGDLEGLSFLRRPIKPVAFGLSLSMLIIVIQNIQNGDRFGAGVAAYAVLITSSASLIMLMFGWWGRMQKMAEYGLLLAATTFLIRSAFIGLTTWGHVDQAAYLSLANAVIAGGAYLLETTDEKRSPNARTRATDRRTA